MRSEQVVGQGFPVGKLQHLESGAGEYGDFAFERMRAMGVARDHDDDAGMAPGGLGQGQGKGGAVRCVPLAALLRD